MVWLSVDAYTDIGIIKLHIFIVVLIFTMRILNDALCFIIAYRMYRY